MNKHILERIAQTNPECEIWWDSSPLVYPKWFNDVISQAPEDKKEEWSKQLHSLYDPNSPETSVVRGVTTNPPLSYQATQNDPDYWAEEIHRLMLEYPDAGVEEIYWMIYKETIRLGSEKLLPLWKASNYKHGYISAQVDPRFAFDYDAMSEQAMELQRIAPNVMVKCPGTKEGYKVIEDLTALGIATNNTSSFSVAQYKACMDAITKGLARAKKGNVGLFRFRSVITHMSDRLSKLGDLKLQAEARGISLSEEEIRWGEIAIFKRAYSMLQLNQHPSKMLMCSMRVNSPKRDDGKISSWHIEKIAGSNAIYTCPPSYIQQLLEVQDKMNEPDPHAVDETIPDDTLKKLMKIPFFVQSYEPEGMTHEEFNRYAPLVATVTEFSRATRSMVDFVAQQFEKAGRNLPLSA